MNQQKVWAEMARRKKQFHKDENWQDIKCWGLFYKSYISKQLKDGDLIPAFGDRLDDIHRRSAWFIPTKKAYNEKIVPLLKYSIDELSSMAGWRDFK